MSGTLATIQHFLVRSAKYILTAAQGLMPCPAGPSYTLASNAGSPHPFDSSLITTIALSEGGQTQMRLNEAGGFQGCQIYFSN
ncbi:hypothetical protein XENTR_v10023035 [Xenopus tropicalis]|nr:hypothetical protein XENTR_v10023035 [Xenopus tropicalis]